MKGRGSSGKTGSALLSKNPTADGLDVCMEWSGEASERVEPKIHPHIMGLAGTYVTDTRMPQSKDELYCGGNQHKREEGSVSSQSGFWELWASITQRARLS